MPELLIVNAQAAQCLQLVIHFLSLPFASFRFSLSLNFFFLLLLLIFQSTDESTDSICFNQSKKKKRQTWSKRRVTNNEQNFLRLSITTIFNVSSKANRIGNRSSIFFLFVVFSFLILFRVNGRCLWTFQSKSIESDDIRMWRKSKFLSSLKMNDARDSIVIDHRSLFSVSEDLFVLRLKTNDLSGINSFHGEKFAFTMRWRRSDSHKK